MLASGGALERSARRAARDQQLRPLRAAPADRAFPLMNKPLLGSLDVSVYGILWPLLGSMIKYQSSHAVFAVESNRLFLQYNHLVQNQLDVSVFKKSNSSLKSNFKFEIELWLVAYSTEAIHRSNGW